MDAISYAHSAKQEQRIKKFINDPDSTSGIVTVPSTIAAGETITIPAGRTAVLPNTTVNGTLVIDGEVFVPSGSSVSTTEVDATVVKQNGSVVANDSEVVHKTGDETISGTKTFSNTIIGNISGTSTKLNNSEHDWVGSGAIGSVVGMLAWKNYNNGHVIFDASSGTSPNGSAIDKANAQVPWSPTYPTLMGWNGGNTFGVRVDSARIADNATYASAFTTAVGGAPSYACRAWVNFNGTGTVAIRASGNVSSITDNGTGDYTVNLITPMIDTNYSLCGMARDGEDDFPGVALFRKLSSIKTTSSSQVHSFYMSTAFDVPECNIMLFR